MKLGSCHKVVDEIGSKHPSYLTSGAKDQYTVLACTNAAGTAIPPFVVLDQKSFNIRFTAGEVPGTVYGLSANGWMTRALPPMVHWSLFAICILPTADHTCNGWPFISLLPSHHQASCRTKVIMFVLPPNTTHITQPLDGGCFSPLKSAWQETCHEFMMANPGKR